MWVIKLSSLKKTSYVGLNSKQLLQLVLVVIYVSFKLAYFVILKIFIVFRLEMNSEDFQWPNQPWIHMDSALHICFNSNFYNPCGTSYVCI